MRGRDVRALRARRAVAIALAVACASTSACGFGDRKRQAQFVFNAAARVRAVKSARVTMVVTTRLKLPESLQRAQEQQGGLQIPGIAQQQQPVTLSYTGAIDFTRERAVLVQGPIAEQPLAIFAGASVWMHRTGEGTERRPWAFLDFERVDAREAESDANPPVGFVAINPTYLVDMAAGALSGSVKKRGTEPIDGVDTVHYTLNYDWDKFLTDTYREDARLRKFSDDRSEALARTFESTQMSETIFPGDIWLDGQGLIKRMRMVMEQRFQSPEQQGAAGRRSRYESTVVIDLQQYGSPVDVKLPTREESISVDTFAQLVREAYRGVEQQQPGETTGTGLPTVPGASPGTGGPAATPAPPGVVQPQVVQQ